MLFRYTLTEANESKNKIAERFILSYNFNQYTYTNDYNLQISLWMSITTAKIRQTLCCFCKYLFEAYESKNELPIFT